MAEPRVVVGLWSLLSTALSIVVVLGGFVAWLLDSKFDGVRDDIAAIRSDVDSLEQKADTTITDVNQKDGEVRDEIASLVPTLTAAATRLEAVSSDLEGLSTDVASIRTDLANLQIAFAEANARQVSFETWIVGRSTGPENLPAGWSLQDAEISKSILGSQNPLVFWSNEVQNFK